MTLVDLKDIGVDYAKTLKLWYDAFNANLSKVKSLGFDETFIRKWNYYLCYCESAFAMRNINVMHPVYLRPNNTSGEKVCSGQFAVSKSCKLPTANC
jgi:cyclopropane-fatty-acyl-phospholipid synthase